MNKKTLFGLVGIAVTLLASISFIFVQQSQQPITTTSRAQTEESLPTTKVESPQESGVQSFSKTYKEYSDPSGYKFLYPADLNVVVEKMDDDPNFYSSVKLKSNKYPGYISVKVISSNFNTLAEWSEANSLSGRSIKVVKLADLDAYQALIDGQYVTVALDSGGVLFTIVSNTEKNSSLWKPAYDKLIGSFAFYQPAGTEDTQEAPAQNTADPDAVDSEEVIE